MENVKVGDIFVASWGYDQTNIDFYQVISRTKKMVTIRMIQKERISCPHIMGSEVMPKKDHFLDRDHPFDETYGKPGTRKLLNSYNNEPMFKTECGYAHLWNGKSRTETYTG